VYAYVCVVSRDVRSCMYIAYLISDEVAEGNRFEAMVLEEAVDR
jgi:hypothetical protein